MTEKKLEVIGFSQGTYSIPDAYLLHINQFFLSFSSFLLFYFICRLGTIMKNSDAVCKILTEKKLRKWKKFYSLKRHLWLVRIFFYFEFPQVARWEKFKIEPNAHRSKWML
jgi:hypothetical protein